MTVLDKLQPLYEIWVETDKGKMVRLCSPNTIRYCHERGVRVKDANRTRTVEIREAK